MILPEILIYQHRFLLEEFHIDEEGCYNKDLFENLLQCKDVVCELYGDLENQYLSIFNAAYYLCADIMRSKFPYLKTKEYCDYIRLNVHADTNKVDAVLCMIIAILHDFPFEKRMKMIESFRKCVNNSFWNRFFIPLPSFNEKHHLIWCGSWLGTLPLTQIYLECNKNKLYWKKWTKDFSEGEIRNLVMNAGVSKEERLNLLDSMAIDIRNYGDEETKNIFLRFYDEISKEEDSNDGYKYRTKEESDILRLLRTPKEHENPFNRDYDNLIEENNLKDKYICECEKRINILEKDLMASRKENVQLMDECTSLKADGLCKDARILELEKENTSLRLKLNESKNTEKSNEQIHIIINNVGTETKNIEQAIGVVEPGAQVTHTNNSK